MFRYKLNQALTWDLPKLLKRNFCREKLSTQQLYPPLSPHPYQQIYPWKNLDDFIELISSNILFNDGRVVGISKPFGVGTHFSTFIYKRSTDIDPRRFGNPKYCIKDALPGLAAKLGFSELYPAFNIDRTSSGIVLLVTDKKLVDKTALKVRHARYFRRTPITWWCITSGTPLLTEPSIKEKVVIEKVIIDERTKSQDFVIVYNPSRSYVSNPNRKAKQVRTEIKIMAENKRLKVALVEVKTSNIRYNFVRCYLASKACFVLGDPRFSSRVGQILGIPIAMPARSTAAVSDTLPIELAKNLQVKSNRDIPLMMHMNRLQMYNYPRGRVTTSILDPNLPEFFQWTMKTLFHQRFMT